MGAASTVKNLVNTEHKKTVKRSPKLTLISTYALKCHLSPNVSHLRNEIIKLWRVQINQINDSLLGAMHV